MSNQTEQCVLGGGCFWCLEAAYQMVKGIEAVVSGYAGGTTTNPTDEQVWAGNTGHAEVVQLTFDPKVITYSDILDVFWAIHDPTQKDRQGYDLGPEYRSVIFYLSEDQKRIAEQSKQNIQKLWDKPVLTAIQPLTHFYQAAYYHQNYYKKHPGGAYCQIIINPKIAHLKEKRASLLKPDAE